MNKYLFPFIVLMILLACKGICQNNNSRNTNSSVHIIENALASDFIHVSYDNKYTEPQKLTLNNFSALFYPIGWSLDNKFAYITESTNSYACDGLPTYFFIYDAKNDSIVYQYCNSCPNDFWTEDHAILRKQLEKYKIKSSNNFNVNLVDDIKILDDDEYEVFWQEKGVKNKINLINGYDDPNYVNYLGSIANPSKKYYIHLLLASESESEIVLLSSSTY